MFGSVSKIRRHKKHKFFSDLSYGFADRITDTNFVSKISGCDFIRVRKSYKVNAQTVKILRNLISGL